MDRVRVDQANQLRDDKAARKVIKGSRWLLLRNADNLKPEQAVKLEELLVANASLATAYLLKDQLKTLWFADDEAPPEAPGKSGITWPPAAALRLWAASPSGWHPTWRRSCPAPGTG